ncbi:hypothetical protein ACOMHN_000663 [Nucella lapillus]
MKRQRHKSPLLDEVIGYIIGVLGSIHFKKDSVINSFHGLIRIFIQLTLHCSNKAQSVILCFIRCMAMFTGRTPFTQRPDDKAAPDATEKLETDPVDFTDMPEHEAPHATESPDHEAPHATESPDNDAPDATESPEHDRNNSKDGVGLVAVKNNV